MEVVGICKNGVEAISLVQTLRPDICLLDIQMPLINGLELIEKINAINKGILKIIISGHDEFEYARKAVGLGVYKYILKPIDENEFVVLLKEIKKELDEARRVTLVNTRKDKIIQVSRNLLRDGLLGEWITGGLELDAEDGIEEYFKELELQLFNTTGLLWVSVSFPVDIIENERIKEQQMIYCRNRLEKYFATDASFCFIQLFSDSFILLNNAANRERWNDIQQELTPVICKDNRWNIMIRKKLVTGGCNNLPRAFAELNGSLKNEAQYLPLVKRVKKYVDENYQDIQLRLSSFAEQSNVSLSYISKLFKHETGVSFTDYLIRYRIKRSLELLTDTDYKVCEISERVGYSSQHYYCEAFKKVMGMAPTQYRRNKK
jgi:two-component system response regulator YesN